MVGEADASAGLPPGAVEPSRPADRGRLPLLRPAISVLTLLCFTLPFLTVSCTKPGAFGRVEAGGTTSYSGYDLAFAGDPHRSADHLLPAAQWRGDSLGVQPLLWIALVFVVAGLVIPFVVRRAADRERASALAAGLALLAVIGGAWVERSELARLVAADAAARRVRLEDPAGTYVGNGQGLVLTVLLLLGTLVVELVLIDGRRRRPRTRLPDRPDRDRDRPSAEGRRRDGDERFVDQRSGDRRSGDRRFGDGRFGDETSAPPAISPRQIGSPWDVDPPRTAASAPAPIARPRSPATPRTSSPTTPRDLG